MLLNILYVVDILYAVDIVYEKRHLSINDNNHIEVYSTFWSFRISRNILRTNTEAEGEVGIRLNRFKPPVIYYITDRKQGGSFDLVPCVCLFCNFVIDIGKSSSFQPHYQSV